MLVAAPTTTIGRKRSDVSRAVRCSTRSKYSALKYWKALKAAQVKKTAAQMDVKATFFHRLLGINAGRPRRSWR